MSNATENWEQFHIRAASYPRWPLEAMVKLVFGKYLRYPIPLTKESRILDVGCGFGNNLLPFLDKGMSCSGTEISDGICQTAMRHLSGRGHSVDIRTGRNNAIPFPDNSFDLLLSLNVLHYEKDAPNIHGAFNEYRRVMKVDGRLIVFTVGREHTIRKKAEHIARGSYRIRDFDFRDGETFFFFDDIEHLKGVSTLHFAEVEGARVTEHYPTLDLDFLVMTGRKHSDTWGNPNHG